MEHFWYQSYAPGVAHTIDPSQYTSLMAMFDSMVSNYADHCAFSNFGVRMSYAELKRLSLAFASYLQQHCHLKKGDRVAIMMPNLLQYPVVMLGILRAGLVVVNVNPLYTAHEVEHQLNDAKAEAIIVVENFAHVLAKALPQTTIKHVITTQLGDFLGPIKGSIINFVVKRIKKMVPNFSIANSVAIKYALAIGAKKRFEPVDLQGDDIAFLQYTGGTTGLAKGAMLSHRNMVANIMQCVEWVRSIITPGQDTVIGALPLYHIFSLTVCCFSFMMMGSHCLLVTNPRDMNSFIKILAKTPATVFIGLNTLFNGIMHHKNCKKADFSKLKLTIAGGMAMQSAVAARWHELTGIHVTQGYGLTEASPVVTINPLTETEFNDSIGLPISSTEIAIRNDADGDLPIGEIGELCVRGPQVMKGYWQQPEETAQVLDANGWLRTGDIARVDERGFVFIVDRKKDMILVSGFNVYPNEIEEIISAIPGVAEVCVVGVPSEKTGEAIKAYIVRDDPDLTKEAIIAYCHTELTNYKIPKEIVFREELPKSNVGKILRRELKECA